ncbi:hypothetical protein [Thiohalocapsa halophila]|uniref:hypothetical protein n=1 Tax=Thiohalocapsa halophila TaxID=69359 RepID=UPI001905B8F8|nr:hypothetical protein [Thiohalocapsa halophila]
MQLVERLIPHPSSPDPELSAQLPTCTPALHGVADIRGIRAVHPVTASAASAGVASPPRLPAVVESGISTAPLPTQYPAAMMTPISTRCLSQQLTIGSGML